MPEFNQAYLIGNLIDEKAQGFSARVFEATSLETGQDLAFKVMRLEHLDDPDTWEKFGLEAEILVRLASEGTLNQLRDCGYLSDIQQERPQAGDLRSFGLDVEGFCRERPDFFERSCWRPYLVLESLPWKDCLLNLIRGVDGSGAHPLRLPTLIGVELALQLASFIEQAQRQGVAYIDFKPEHAYWDWERHHLRMIDANVSLILDGEHLRDKFSDALVQRRLREDLRNCAAGVLFTVFTGRDFRYQGSNTPPSAAPSHPQGVDERFANVTWLDFGMEPTLYPKLTDVINRMVDISQPLTAAKALQELQGCASELGLNPGTSISNVRRQARDNLQRGLEALRRANAEIRTARDCFVAASQAVDEDYKRLYQQTDQFYQKRVLP